MFCLNSVKERPCQNNDVPNGVTHVDDMNKTVVTMTWQPAGATPGPDTYVV